MRLTRIPAKNAASWPAPIAKILRPSGVACSTTMKITASKPKKMIDHGRCVPLNGSTPMSVRSGGKPLIVSVGKITCAMPRYSVSVPIVTASEGRPSRVTRKPLKAPSSAPSRTAAIASQIASRA